MAVCADRLKVDSLGMRRLADASGNGFELLFHDRQSFLFKTGIHGRGPENGGRGKPQSPLKSVCKMYMSFEGRGLFKLSRV